VSIRTRIFAVIGAVIAAAFLQTLFVLYLEGERSRLRDAQESALWRYESQSSLVRLVIELDGTQRAALLTGNPELRVDYERLWAVYERSVTLLPQYIAEPEVRKDLAAIDALIRDWHVNASLALLPDAGPTPGMVQRLEAVSTPRMRRIRGDLDRFETRERNRINDQRMSANTKGLQTTLQTLAIPALAVVMLLVLVAFIARIALDPLAAFAESARQISDGRFDVSLPPPSRDEIGALVRAFSDMTTAVQRRQRDLSDALAREREVSQLLDTQRAKAEREHDRLLATIGTVPVAILIVDAATRRTVVQNRTAESLLGREPEDEAGRAAYWNSFTVTQRDGTPVSADRWGWKRILSGDVVVGEELVVRHPDGRVIPILMSGAPLRDDDAAIIGGVVAFQDITSLYEVDRLKSEFVSIVSHELRTPLTSIKGALQLLLAEVPLADPDHATLMNVALSNTDRLVRIINDILDISKIEAGKLELNAKPHAVAEVLALSVQNVQHLAQSAGLTIATVLEPGVPPVHVDLDRTIQVVVNLLSNALKFAPARSEVTLSARRDGDGFVAVSITDRGRGIPPDKLGLLFQKFQQLDGGNTRKVRGTGLGLAIVKALVEMQGGRVWVESQVGVGSTFTVTVPVARVEHRG
jgi:PAS domain S-box-containing protein